MRVRVKFSKYGVNEVYRASGCHARISRRRCAVPEIDIAYSEGMSPHMIMSFAQPLGVGLTSDGEYMDVEAAHTDCI